MTGRFEIPAGLEAQRSLGPEWVTWLDGLTVRTGDLLDEWELTVDGASMHGYCALVLPVTTAAGEPAALKVALPDEESEHEALALQRWGGRGAVRLLRADQHRRAMLLERLKPMDLASVSDEEACEIVGGLYQRLHISAPPQLATVTSYVERWVDPLTRLPRSAPIPHRMVAQAVGLARDLVAGSGSDGRLIHGDLHQHNVLAGEREPWLVIDPKAMSGDPHYEPAPMLWNTWEAVLASGNARWAIRRRLDAIVDAGGLDPHRARDWVIVRMVVNAHWTLEDADNASRGLTRDEHDWITLCLTVAKAVQE
jgi:streptomycin 6-kinase